MANDNNNQGKRDRGFGSMNDEQREKAGRKGGKAGRGEQSGRDNQNWSGSMDEDNDMGRQKSSY